VGHYGAAISNSLKSNKAISFSSEGFETALLQKGVYYLDHLLK
jgi:hypothetical protein